MRDTSSEGPELSINSWTALHSFEFGTANAIRMASVELRGEGLVMLMEMVEVWEVWKPHELPRWTAMCQLGWLEALICHSEDVLDISATDGSVICAPPMAGCCGVSDADLRSVVKRLEESLS